jgi:hypothetical protein
MTPCSVAVGYFAASTFTLKMYVEMFSETVVFYPKTLHGLTTQKDLDLN